MSPLLDPIVSLSVALAEAPGTCVFMLGSGVSRDAGVPTGAEVMRAGLHRLFQLETVTTEQIDEAVLDAWLVETGRTMLSYSDLLELIAPDVATRREYLASFFAGKAPGPTHEALADLAATGMVRVFVTTNFDRLLEQALHRRGIEPIVTASDDDLNARMPREHASCIVIKPHGDYLRQTLKNTPTEVAELEPNMTGELGEVFDRYGIVVLGYSGADAGVARVLRARRSRYGLWWVARGELGDAAADVVEATGGRVIVRATGAEFLADLRARLAVFEVHPSGQTPGAVHDETLNLLKGGQHIALDELLRREALAYERAVTDGVAAAQQLHPNAEDAGETVWKTTLPGLERRLSSLLPLALHDGDAFAREVAQLARGLERRPLTGVYTAWSELPHYAATWLGYVVGALLVHLERVDHLAPLLDQTWKTLHGDTERLVWLPGEIQNVVGTSMTREDGQRWLSPGWEYLARSLKPLTWLEERYPELFGADEPRHSMARFDFLICLASGLAEHRAVPFYTLGGGAAEDFALRVHDDPVLRARVAAALGVTLDDFDERAPAALNDLPAFHGGFVNSPGEAQALLARGRADH